MPLRMVLIRLAPPLQLSPSLLHDFFSNTRALALKMHPQLRALTDYSLPKRKGGREPIRVGYLVETMGVGIDSFPD